MRSAPTEPPTWEAVRKRNSIERMKAVKPGLDVIRELPEMIATGYEAVPEEDFVRLQWYGAYHDKPKVGTFMLRVKIPAGFLQPRQLALIGRLSRDLGGDHGELTTRQNVQIHYVDLTKVTDVMRALGAVGLTTREACGDTVRNVMACHLAGACRSALWARQPARVPRCHPMGRGCVRALRSQPAGSTTATQVQDQLFRLLHRLWAGDVQRRRRDRGHTHPR